MIKHRRYIDANCSSVGKDLIESIKDIDTYKSTIDWIDKDSYPRTLYATFILNIYKRS